MPAITDFCWHRTATHIDCCFACSCRPSAALPAAYPVQPLLLLPAAFDQTIVPLCLRSTRQPIDELCAQPLSPLTLAPYCYPNRLLFRLQLYTLCCSSCSISNSTTTTPACSTTIDSCCSACSIPPTIAASACSTMTTI